MWAIFFRRSEFVEGIALEDRKTVTADWYTTICLLKVFSVIERQPLRTREFLQNHRIGTLPHPPYSPDLAPCDFWLFPKLKDQLRGRRFFSNEELIGALFLAIEEIPKEEWKCALIPGLNA
ncbi:Mariner transposase [Oopsacas minuta]|uniref:Mariner transposase n=1 Tax=Oopsacas minuta TaxID=111878 RepID=A0AAV7K4X7_9METZ|nr:Mariner transposase [Oopsacas minuta]